MNIRHARNLWVSLVAALTVATAPSAGLAQETRGSEFPDLEEDELGVLDVLKVRLTLAERYIGNADFGSFDATTHQPEARLRVSMPLSRKAAVRLIGTGRALLYDIDGSSNLFGTGVTTDKPFDNLYSWGLRLQGAYVFDPEWTAFSEDERWLLLLQGGVRATWEGGSDMGDGLRGAGSIAAGYRLGDRLEVAAGISLGSRLLRSGVGISPLLEFDWRINEDWKLKSYGTGLQLERTLTDDWIVFTRARLEGSSFRLADRGGAVGKGSLRVRQVPVGLGVQWKPLRMLRLRLTAGVVAYNQMRLKNENNDIVTRITSDPAPYVAFRVDLRR